VADFVFPAGFGGRSFYRRAAARGEDGCAAGGSGRQELCRSFGSEQFRALTIPDTVLAVNSPTPMSERVVHYEIDARYDAAKHTVDATEVLTYHNLTGQALDHFPVHLYQNAFQPEGHVGARS
jgi:hypothetical protein